MAYTRTNWVNEETPLSAANMNNIENGIEDLQIDDDVIDLFIADGWTPTE